MQEVRRRGPVPQALSFAAQAELNTPAVLTSAYRYTRVNMCMNPPILMSPQTLTPTCARAVRGPCQSDGPPTPTRAREPLQRLRGDGRVVSMGRLLPPSEGTGGAAAEFGAPV